MSARKIRANLLFLVTAFIWGSAFVAQRMGNQHVGPFTFNAARMLVAGCALFAIALLLRNTRFGAPPADVPPAVSGRALLFGGLFCGLALFFASSFQQVGLMYTTAGKAGFITTLYIIFVPILGVFLKKKIRGRIWLSVALSVAGLFLLSFFEDMRLNFGDFLMLFCALCYAAHILIIDHYANRVDSVRLSCIQFFVAAAFAFAVMFLFESPDIASVMSAWVPLLYVSVLSGAFGFTFQIIAQKDTDPAVAALLMSLEAVFAAVTGYFVLREILTPGELVGCLLMFCAIVLAQLPQRPEGKVHG